MLELHVGKISHSTSTTQTSAKWHLLCTDRDDVTLPRCTYPGFLKGPLKDQEGVWLIYVIYSICCVFLIYVNILSIVTFLLYRMLQYIFFYFISIISVACTV